MIEVLDWVELFLEYVAPEMFPVKLGTVWMMYASVQRCKHAWGHTTQGCNSENLFCLYTKFCLLNLGRVYHFFKHMSQLAQSFGWFEQGKRKVPKFSSELRIYNTTSINQLNTLKLMGFESVFAKALKPKPITFVIFLAWSWQRPCRAYTCMLPQQIIPVR